MATVWVFAVILLAGLVYWGSGAKEAPRSTDSGQPRRSDHTSQASPPSPPRQKTPTERPQDSSPPPRHAEPARQQTASAPEQLSHRVQPRPPDSPADRLKSTGTTGSGEPTAPKAADTSSKKTEPAEKPDAQAHLSPPPTNGTPSGMTQARASTQQPSSSSIGPQPQINGQGYQPNGPSPQAGSAPAPPMLAAIRPPAVSDTATPPAPSPPPPVPPFEPSLGRAAIVIDDLGPDMEIARKLLALPFPITFSIMPYQRHSKEIAELAHAQHREALLHMPMEPKGYPKTNPGQGALLVSMSAEAVRSSFRQALSSTPHITGMNNHMGSKFTENQDAMRIVLTEVHQRGLFFLDSATSPMSAGVKLARELQIPFRLRDIFLDHKQTTEFTKAQLELLIRKAKVQGTAIAIGHPHETTLRVLQKEGDSFRRERISIVPLREIIAERARSSAPQREKN